MDFNRYLLTFRSKSMELEYRNTVDYGNRIFQRIGLVTGTMWWTFVALYAHFFYTGGQSLQVLFALACIAPFGIVAFGVTYIAKLRKHYHWLSAVMNTLAGYLAIYIGHVLLHDMTLTLISLVAVTFWDFFILRLRFTVAIVAAISYVVGYQVALVLSASSSPRDVFLFSFTLWLIYVVCVVAAHAFEKSSRLIYVQGRTIEEQKDLIQREQQKSESLLLNILPPSIAERLKGGSAIIADSHPSVTVLFADIVGFTSLSSSLSASRVVTMLNEIFLLFDELSDTFALEKIKTIGDAYMVACGIPNPVPDHAERTADMSLAMLGAVQKYNEHHVGTVQVRIGISSGPVVAGVIGRRKFHYDLWGDTVNVASRMESHGVAGEIQVSDATYLLLKGKYRFVERGAIEVKGRGTMVTHILKGQS
jgi:adenylate cyclase